MNYKVNINILSKNRMIIIKFKNQSDILWALTYPNQREINIHTVEVERVLFG